MNLYEIRFRHYSQKDNEEGILTYLVAKSDEDVYEWISSDLELKNGTSIYSSWADREEDDEDYKERIIECNGDMYDNETEICDLYYGLTLYGWGMVYENISNDDVNKIESLNIDLEKTN